MCCGRWLHFLQAGIWLSSVAVFPPAGLFTTSWSCRASVGVGFGGRGSAATHGVEAGKGWLSD